MRVAFSDKDNLGPRHWSPGGASRTRSLVRTTLAPSGRRVVRTRGRLRDTPPGDQRRGRECLFIGGASYISVQQSGISFGGISVDVTEHIASRYVSYRRLHVLFQHYTSCSGR